MEQLAIKENKQLNWAPQPARLLNVEKREEKQKGQDKEAVIAQGVSLILGSDHTLSLTRARLVERFTKQSATGKIQEEAKRWGVYSEDSLMPESTNSFPLPMDRCMFGADQHSKSRRDRPWPNPQVRSAVPLSNRARPFKEVHESIDALFASELPSNRIAALNIQTNTGASDSIATLMEEHESIPPSRINDLLASATSNMPTATKSPTADMTVTADPMSDKIALLFEERKANPKSQVAITELFSDPGPVPAPALASVSVSVSASASEPTARQPQETEEQDESKTKAKAQQTTTISASMSTAGRDGNPFAQWMAGTTEDESVWYYQDLANTIQGPFTSAEMNGWNKEGYFFPKLLVSFKDKVTFRPLSEVLNKTEILQPPTATIKVTATSLHKMPLSVLFENKEAQKAEETVLAEVGPAHSVSSVPKESTAPGRAQASKIQELFGASVRQGPL